MSNGYDGLRLEHLLAIGTGDFVDWGDRELADILQHQLQAPLLADLRPHASQIQSLGLENRGPDAMPLDTFGDLLSHPCPTLDLLRLAKDFAKGADSRINDPLPAAIAQALYLLVIAAALLAHGERITSMDDAALREGLAWVASQKWVDRSQRRIAANALASFPAGE